jgi:hypothetical protein
MCQGISLRGKAAVVVDVFSGTALEFRPLQERVEVLFLPWHRWWSHSLTLVAVLGAAIALLGGWLPGLVYALGSLVHILEDQLGYMGSNLLYPFTRQRVAGLELFHSGDALPNLLAVWLSAVLLLMNLDRYASAPVFTPWRLLWVGLVIPWSLIGALGWWKRRRQHRRRGTDDVPNGCSDLDRALLAGTTLVDVSQDGERVLAGERPFTEDESGDA